MEKKILWLIISFVITTIMLLSNKFYLNSDLIKSRGYFLLSIIILLVNLISVSLIFKVLKIGIIGFNDNGISQSKYDADDNANYTQTNLMDFFKTRSFVLILMSLFFYISLKVSFLIYDGKDNIKDLENIEIVMYVILAFFTPIVWFIMINEKKLINKSSVIYIIILLVLTSGMVFLFRNKTKQFFDNSKYGYICPRDKFKDVIIEGNLICPNK